MFDIYHYPTPKKPEEKNQEKKRVVLRQCPKHGCDLISKKVYVSKNDVSCGDTGYLEISVYVCPASGCTYCQSAENGK